MKKGFIFSLSPLPMGEGARRAGEGLKRKSAFTLAEVLITLGIIGVVAAITLPSVIQNINDRQNIVKWKKAFSVISNAIESAVQEEYLTDVKRPNIDVNITPYSKEIYYQVFKRLNTDDFCVKESPYDHECPFYSTVASYNASPKCKSYNPSETKTACMYAGGGGYAKLPDGIIVYAHSYIWDHPAFTIDVNGPLKGPNTVGRDIFLILIRNNKAIPAGADGYELRACDKNVKSGAGANGIGSMAGVDCSAKYLLE